MDLLTEWANWRPSKPPFVLDADRPMLTTGRSLAHAVTISGWKDAYRSDRFCAPKDQKLHLGLFPQPFWGDLRRASIFILLLNPGLGPTDYYGEYEVPGYRDALLANLKQRFPKRSPRFLFLDPQYAWHGGFGWWNGKLGRVIDTLADVWAVSFATARHRLANELASIELVPYHSPRFRDADGWIRRLQSVALARAFVNDVVAPRARRGDAAVIVTRQAKAWDLTGGRGVVVYTGQQARAAHLTPNSAGGRAILDVMIRKRPS